MLAAAPAPRLQAFFSAAAKLCIRSLNSSEPVASIIFAMAGVSSLGSAAACALLPHHFVLPRSAAMWGVLGAAGVLGCAVQLLVTTALKLAKAAPVLAMSYFMGTCGVGVWVGACGLWICGVWGGGVRWVAGTSCCGWHAALMCPASTAAQLLLAHP